MGSTSNQHQLQVVDISPGRRPPRQWGASTIKPRLINKKRKGVSPGKKVAIVLDA